MIPFQWDRVTTAEHLLLVEPSCGELAASSEMYCELSISASSPGNIDEDVVCHLGHVDEIVSMHVSAVVKTSELVIDEAELDFGLVRFGESAVRVVTIRNPGRSIIEWTIQLSPSVMCEVDADEFKFCPSSGTILPLDSCTIEVTLQPKCARCLNTVLEVLSADGDKSLLGATADIQCPKVCLLKSSVHIELYVNATISVTAVLFNQTALSAKFEWGRPTCLGPIDVDVNIEPRSGVIEARQQVNVTVSITPHGVGRIDNMIVPCCVEGMNEMINLSLTAYVRYDLTVVYSVSSDRQSWLTGDGILIDFGGNNHVRDMPKLYLRLQNTSGIAANYQLAIEYFKSGITTEMLKEEPISCKKGGPVRLQKTANLAVLTAKKDEKTVNELRAKMLKGGRGVAFHLSSSSGRLEPFSEEIVEIMACADLWGFYLDRLQCNISNLDTFNIPVLMSVVDYPVLFQMVLHDPSLLPIVRFGCAVESTSVVRRRTRILNRSPVDIRIDWQIFNVSPDDQQLLDLVVVYGNPFPLKDDSGKEIIVHCDVDGTVTEDIYDQSLITEESLEELAATRPQLIKLNLRDHEGTEATTPYSIEPSQSVRSSLFVVVIKGQRWNRSKLSTRNYSRLGW